MHHMCEKIWQRMVHHKSRSKTEGVSGEGNWITIWPKVHFQGLTCNRNFLLTWFRIFFRGPRGIPKSLRSLSWQRALKGTDVPLSQSHTYTGETPDLLCHLCACITSDSRSRLSFWNISRYCCRPSLVRVCSSVLQLSWYLSVWILQTGRKIVVLKMTYEPRNFFFHKLFLLGKQLYPYCFWISPLIGQQVKQDEGPWGKRGDSLNHMLIYFFSFLQVFLDALPRLCPTTETAPLKSGCLFLKRVCSLPISEATVSTIVWQ